jgi:NYN domain
MASSDPTDKPVWVIVLLDWQNIYSCAREAFGLEGSGGIAGNVYPLKLAVHLASGIDPLLGRTRKLQEVRIYRGRPDGAKYRDWYRAWQSQTSAWKKAGGERLVERYRDLRERDGVPVEKGVDVSLAIDLVSMAHQDAADRVVVVSSDTDMEPALTLATSIRGAGFAEVAGWDGPRESAAILSVEGVAQHRLGKTDYERLHDPTDYNLSIRVRRRRSDGGWDDQIQAEGRKRRS